MDTFFFWISKLVWMVIKPDFLLVLFLFVGLICLYAGALKKAKLILGLVVIAMLTITVVPIGKWLLSPLENRFPTNPELPEKVDGIIVLAGAEDNYRSALWKQVELGRGVERLYYFMKFMHEYPDAIHVFTGGTGSIVHPEYKSADQARKIFRGLGFDVDKILFERESKNTYENGVNSYKMVKPKPGEKWILITTAWHMPRSVGIFRKLGWPVIPYPVDHWTEPGSFFEIDLDLAGHLRNFKIGAKEWVGLLSYYISGKTSALFPGEE